MHRGLQPDWHTVAHLCQRSTLASPQAETPTRIPSRAVCAEAPTPPSLRLSQGTARRFAVAEPLRRAYTAARMIGRHLPVRTGAEAVRVVRALGTHRYVGGRLLAVHALAIDAVAAAYASASPGGTVPEALTAACTWARAVLDDPSIDADSRDPRLLRTATADELSAVLEAFWAPGPLGDRAHDALLDAALRLGLEVPAHAPFDEAFEDEMHPLLVDAGWELIPLGALDPVRHRGVIEAYDEPILFEAARFEEESAIPPRVHLQELPALGLAELLRGVDADGELVEPFVLWTDGDEVYQDYLLRGVLKAAKIAGALEG